MLPSVQIYLDESIDKEGRIFVIGGFVGRSDAWSSLLCEWIDRIQPHRLPHPIKAFHMTDCENGGGEFRDQFGWNKSSRTQLIIDLIEIICRHKVGMFGFGLPVHEYEALETINGTRLGKSQYHFLFQTALSDLAISLEQAGAPREALDFFVDRNSPHETWARWLHKEMTNDDRLKWRGRIGRLTFENKERLRLLQVADLGAFETMKHLTNLLFNEGRARKSYQKLADSGNVWRLATYDRSTLTEMWQLKNAAFVEFTRK